MADSHDHGRNRDSTTPLPVWYCRRNAGTCRNEVSRNAYLLDVEHLHGIDGHFRAAQSGARARLYFPLPTSHLLLSTAWSFQGELPDPRPPSLSGTSRIEKKISVRCQAHSSSRVGWSRMEKTLLEILPLAIAATFSPSGLLLVTMILSGKDRPVKNSVVFLSDAVLFLISLGSFIMVAYNSAVTSKSRPGSLAGAIDILLGLLIIVVIGRSVIFRKKREKG